LATKNKVKEVIDTIEPLNTLFDYSPVDEMKVALDKHLNPNANDSDSSAGTSLNFGANAEKEKVEAEEDTTNTKINDAFDKLLQ